MKYKANILFYIILLLQSLFTLYIEGFSLEFLLISCILIILSYISKEDWNTGYIYLKDNLLVLILSLVYVILNKRNIDYIFLNLFIFSAPLFLIESIYQRFTNDKDKFLIGGGDIILISSMNLLLGFKKFIIVLFISSLCVIIVSKIRKKAIVPYGPFLHLGFFISYFWGANILTLFNMRL